MDLEGNNNTFLGNSKGSLYNKSPDHNKKSINQVWTKENFDNHKRPDKASTYYSKNKLVLDLKTTWANKEEEPEEEEPVEDEEEGEKEPPSMDTSIASTPEKESPTSNHHARRPMNAFLIFCKKHRPVVRRKYPNLENRGVTRILGEWWALLEEDEKGFYKDLALQYKDAFLSANPNFKWYKLPAPPLRTTNHRPLLGSKTSPLLSPTHTMPSTEFTPGKLADETQLGNLTLLMNINQNCCVKNDVSKKQCLINYNNNNNNNEDTVTKPIKKRKYVDIEPMLEIDSDDEANNMTQQELMNKVVDSMFPEEDQHVCKKEVRKSGRACKGRRYAEFMMEGNLLGNKQMKLYTSKLDVKNQFDLELSNKIEDLVQKSPKLDLTETIKRLAERTNVQFDEFDYTETQLMRTESEPSDDALGKVQVAFNLDQKIAELPSLSYEAYLQRKKESKRRKPLRPKTNSSPKSKGGGKVEGSLVGAKKRKNKSSITRLEKPKTAPVTTNATENDTDLIGLATLAEVASNIDKINSDH